MLTAITAIAGLLSGLLPGLINIFGKHTDHKHEERMFELQMEAARQGLEFKAYEAEVNAMAREAESLRLHDASLDGGPILNTIRASIRPVLTYFFFFLFLAVKISLLIILWQNEYTNLELVATLWDEYTASLFAAIIGFWFGNRASMHLMKGNSFGKVPINDKG